MDVGETIVDLTEVRDPQSLDGRVITVTGSLGHLEVDVPADMNVVARTHVTGAGGINAFGRDGGGVDTRLTAVHTAGPDAARLTIDVTLHIGGIDVHAEPVLRSSR
jgi:predicted membrane protein